MSWRGTIAALLIFVGSLSAASGHVAGPVSCVAKNPSALDYLALASMADSQRPLAMAAYHPSQAD